LYATGSTTLAKLPKGTAEQVLAMNAGATAPDWGSVDLTVLPTISVAKGGTALSSFVAGDILYATGTTTLAKLAKGTAAQQLAMNAGATAPEWITASGGTILSAKSLAVTDTGSESGSAPSQLSQFDMSFAPTTSDGKLYFETFQYWGSPNNTGAGGYFYDVTNSAQIGAIGDASGSRLRLSWWTKIEGGGYPHSVGFGCWHEPGTTTSRDYTIYGNCQGNAHTLYINRNGDDTNNTTMYNGRGASTFTITEYAAGSVTLT